MQRLLIIGFCLLCGCRSVQSGLPDPKNSALLSAESGKVERKEVRQCRFAERSFQRFLDSGGNPNLFFDSARDQRAFNQALFSEVGVVKKEELLSYLELALDKKNLSLGDSTDQSMNQAVVWSVLDGSGLPIAALKTKAMGFDEFVGEGLAVSVIQSLQDASSVKDGKAFFQTIEILDYFQLDMGAERLWPAILMSFAPGTSLKSRIESSGWNQASMRAIEKVIRGLADFHQTSMTNIVGQDFLVGLVEEKIAYQDSKIESNLQAFLDFQFPETDVSVGQQVDGLKRRVVEHVASLETTYKVYQRNLDVRSVLHGDFHYGNVFVGEDDAVTFIDSSTLRLLFGRLPQRMARLAFLVIRTKI